MEVLAGSADITTYFSLRLAADGTAATGLTITELDLQYVRSGAAPAAKVDATALAATDSAHGDNQAIEIDATDQPGVYRVDWPDAAFAAGVREVVLSVKHTTCFPADLRVNLTPVPANVESWNNTSVPSEHTAGYPIVTIKDGTGTGEIDTASGVVLAKDHTGANLATAAALDAVDNFVDTEIADIQSRLPAALTAGGNMKADALAISGSTTAADNAEIVFDTDFASNYNTTLDQWSTNLTRWAGTAPLALASQRVQVSVGEMQADTINSSSLSVTGLNAIGTQIWTTQATRTLTALDEDSTTLDLDATIRAAVGLASANLDTQLTAIDDYIDTEIAAIQTTLSSLFTTALTEAYRADGATGTVAQLLYEILAHHAEKAISGTTLTTKKLDGSTTAATHTLDSSSTPTSITRAT